MGINELGRPAGIAIDKKRHLLYAADVKNNRIAVFDIGNLTFLRFLGGPVSQGGREPGRFLSPTNVAVDGEGKLYVTDTFNHRIQIFDAAGKFVRAFGSHGVRPGQFVRPKGIAVDSQGHIYVADAEFNNFQVFSPTGQILMAVGSLGEQPGEFSLIAGLHIDAEDRVFTTEQYGGRVQVFKYLASPPGAVGKEVAASKK
ncbi:MAG: 6-bladed beta-propeller [Acidobacteria bacterium]|nr:6-bladed beta-propeller [Acidobacteriota bacterium]